VNAPTVNIGIVGQRFWRYLVAVQALAVVVFLAVPLGGWMHYLWQVAVGWTGAACVFAGARRSRGAAAAVWYLLGVGLALNVSGIGVVAVRELVFHQTSTPNLADLFFLGLYPPVLAGLALIIYQRTAGAGWGQIATSTFMSAVLTIGAGLIVWELLIWNHERDSALSFSVRAIAAAYPLADLMVLALMIRLLVGDGAGSPVFRLILLSLTGFLGADIGWAVLLKGGTDVSPLTRHLLEMTSMSGFVLMGLAALNPVAREVAVAHDPARERDAGAAWTAIGVSLAAAPTVLLIEALLDHMYNVK
jgi:hypothetical protein